MKVSPLLCSAVVLTAAIVPAGAQQPAASGIETVRVRRVRDTHEKPCGRQSGPVIERVRSEYGSIFAADRRAVTPPPVCLFSSEEEVAAFQGKLKIKKARIGGADIELQEAAMDALLEAVAEAEARGLRITPVDGTVAGRRGFAETIRIWNSRFFPALDFWVARGRISKEDADAARSMPILDQVAQVFEWESKGYYFSTGKNRPIVSSVAPPGTSQHLSLLAFDVEQGNAAVTQILNRHGWYRTVVNDTPHFTYLGVTETELPARGLRAVVRGGFTYWVPAL